MAIKKLHHDEVDIDLALVQKLLRAQFPQWADLPLTTINNTGTDNVIIRLGETMMVRLPRIAGAAGCIDKEHTWLPVLAQQLPLTVPVPLAKGNSGAGYPFAWSVYPWLTGETATVENIVNHNKNAVLLAQFVRALQHIPADGSLPPGSHNGHRGVPLANRDAQTRAVIATLGDRWDTQALIDIWEIALNAPVWDKAPVWLHGDIQAGNLLVQHGTISAVIDFGCLGMGDPACDLLVAWNLLNTEARQIFRQTLNVDDATWARGKGWALSVGVIAYPYYVQSNPTLAEINRCAIDAVLNAHHGGH